MPAAFFLLLLAACLPSAWQFKRKALDDYVAKADPHYRYTLLKKETPSHQGVTVYSLNMTSQKWLDASVVDISLWTHQLFIILPKDRTVKDTCLLYIEGGRNDNVSNTHISVSIDLAKSTGSCVALLNQIPNQPITFRKIPLKECKNAIEDYAMTCSWWMFLNSKSAPPHSLMEFPMTKAIVRAMDTITAVLRKESHKRINIRKFTLIGLSKRGFPAWLAAAVDARVHSFISIVADSLNMVKNFHHEYRSLGGWSFALRSLYNTKITRQLDGPRFKELASHIDPLEYNERYSNKPKFIVKTTGDEIFLLDNTYFYWDKLKGEKHLRMIPNKDHFIQLRDHIDPIKAFYVATVHNQTKPKVSWKRTQTNTSGIIRLFTDQTPSSIKYYVATAISSTRRDFRGRVAPGLPRIIIWVSHNVPEVEKGVYEAKVTKPSRRWKGFFIEATYKGPGKNKYVFTTEVQIIPNTYPFKDCKGEGCYGKVV